MATILFDGRDTFRSAGTGTTTYASNLGLLAKDLGHKTQIVVSTDVRLNPKNPLMAEVRFHDARQKALTIPQQIGRGCRYLLGAPMGIAPVELKRTGEIVDPSPLRSKAFDQVFTNYRLFETAEFHFRRYRRRASLGFDRPPEIFHATQPIPLSVRGAPNLYTIHDAVPLKLPYATLDDKKYFYDLLMCLCRTSDHVVTVSETARRDIISLTGIEEDRITNTYQSVRFPQGFLHRSESDIADDLANLFALDFRSYFLFVGALEPKKNVSRLVDAFAASSSKLPLVLAGGLGWQYEEDVKRIQDEKFLKYRLADGLLFPQRHVRHLSYVRFDQLVTLIQGARAVIFPSLYEGFGLPVLEAMTLGTPVITSSVSSLPEIAGDAALLVDPMEVGSISKAIRQLDRDTDLCAELAARGRKRAEFFSLEAYQARISALYRRFGI